jgi:hypothetical protein
VTRFGKGWWWDLACFNGLSKDQQQFLVTEGFLPIGYEPEGECPNGAEVAIETEHDDFPGPRFYCMDCGLGYLARLKFGGLPRPAE